MVSLGFLIGGKMTFMGPIGPIGPMHRTLIQVPPQEGARGDVKGWQHSDAIDREPADAPP